MFGEFWADYEKCEEIVTSSWIATRDLVENSVLCKNRLKDWSKAKFKGKFSELKRLKDLLAYLKNQTPSSQVAKQIWVVGKQIDSLLKDEETFWSQKVKSLWL